MAEVGREGVLRGKKGLVGLWKKCWWWGGQTLAVRKRARLMVAMVWWRHSAGHRGRFCYDKVVQDQEWWFYGNILVAMVWHQWCSQRYGFSLVRWLWYDGDARVFRLPQIALNWLKKEETKMLLVIKWKLEILSNGIHSPEGQTRLPFLACFLRQEVQLAHRSMASIPWQGQPASNVHGVDFSFLKLQV